MEKEATAKKKMHTDRKSHYEFKNPVFGKGAYVGTADMFKNNKQ